MLQTASFPVSMINLYRFYLHLLTLFYILRSDHEDGN